jgi:transcriptional regulator with XRE-family HTH domain
MLAFSSMNAIVKDLQSQLRSMRGQLPSFARESGISYSWLCKFQAGKMNNPTANTIERLQRAIDAKKDAA